MKKKQITRTNLHQRNRQKKEKGKAILTMTVTTTMTAPPLVAMKTTKRIQERKKDSQFRSFTSAGKTTYAQIA